VPLLRNGVSGFVYRDSIDSSAYPIRLSSSPPLILLLPVRFVHRDTVVHEFPADDGPTIPDRSSIRYLSWWKARAQRSRSSLVRRSLLRAARDDETNGAIEIAQTSGELNASLRALRARARARPVLTDNPQTPRQPELHSPRLHSYRLHGAPRVR